MRMLVPFLAVLALVASGACHVPSTPTEQVVAPIAQTGDEGTVSGKALGEDGGACWISNVHFEGFPNYTSIHATMQYTGYPPPNVTIFYKLTVDKLWQANAANPYTRSWPWNAGQEYGGYGGPLHLFLQIRRDSDGHVMCQDSYCLACYP